MDKESNFWISKGNMEGSSSGAVQKPQQQHEEIDDTVSVASHESRRPSSSMYSSHAPYPHPHPHTAVGTHRPPYKPQPESTAVDVDIANLVFNPDPNTSHQTPPQPPTSAPPHFTNTPIDVSTKSVGNEVRLNASCKLGIGGS
jgi:hypothetical protein